jgi:hypothetical protein
MKRSAMIFVWLALLSGACYAGLDSIEGVAPWGVVTLTVDKEAGKHFPLIGWVAEPSRYSGTHGFVLRLLIDKEDDTYDTKGCLRASFYVTSASGKRIRTAAVMTDDKRSHAMMRFHYGFFDGALEPWTVVVVKWTPDCRDTWNFYNLTRPAWVK